jgi:CheY-like chemotaxis protein
MQPLTDAARMILRVAVADDERPTRALVISALRRHPDVEMVAEAIDGRSLSWAIRETAVDLVIMDDALPELECVTESLESRGLVVIRVATDLPDDARQARVLLKPFTQIEFDEALRDARQQLIERAVPVTGEPEPPSPDTRSTSPMWNVGQEQRIATPSVVKQTTARIGRLLLLGAGLVAAVVSLLLLAPPMHLEHLPAVDGKTLRDVLNVQPPGSRSTAKTLASRPPRPSLDCSAGTSSPQTERTSRSSEGQSHDDARNRPECETIGEQPVNVGRSREWRSPSWRDRDGLSRRAF